MEKKWNIHTVIPRLAAVLLMLVLVTTSMVTGRYARYTTASTGSDSARVAKFVVSQSIRVKDEPVTQSLSMPSPEIKPGETVTYIVEVKMDTEMAVRNTITFENTYDNLPLVYQIAGSGGDTYTDDCQPGTYTKTYEASVTWPLDQNNVQYIGMVDLLNITVTSEQID